MEVMLRCSVSDRPGALAALAGAIADAGGDIEAVEVIESGQGAALDDLVVIVEDPAQLERLLASLKALVGLAVVHAGPSRGHPGDAVTRLAVGFESLLNGAMTLENGLEALLGGLLRATSIRMLPAAEAPRESDKILVLAVDSRVVVVSRDYRFTSTERERAEAILRAGLEAVRARG